LRNAVKSPLLWLALTTIGLAGCGAGRSAPSAATPVPVPPPAKAASSSSSSSSSTTTARATTTASPEASSTPTPASTTATATTPTSATATTPTSTTATTQTQVAHALESCGSVDFGPSSSYLASGITATASDCATARAVASASRSHQFDPPPATASVQGFTAEGFSCAGQRDTGSMLALSDYRCTRGSSVVTFQRS
jgi:hypothetical protein